MAYNISMNPTYIRPIRSSKGAPNKRTTSYRLTDEALSILAELSQKYGITATSVMEIAVRDVRDKDKRGGIL